MATFKNAAGQEFEVTITAWSLKRVREVTGFELGKLYDEGCRRLTQLAADFELFSQVLFVLVPQAKEMGEEAFWMGMTGDTLDAAWQALQKAYSDFSPSHRRSLLTAMAQKAEQVAVLATEKAVKEIETIDPAKALTELEAELKSQSTSNEPAFGSQVSSR